MVVYLVTNRIDGKKYVGKTQKTVQARWADHCGNARNPKKQEYLYRAIRKHGAENFSVEILAQVSTLEELNSSECRFIAELGTLAPDGYNMTHGGEGVVPTEEVREKIRAKALGRPTSDLQKTTASQVHGGKPKSAETKAKMAASWDKSRRKMQSNVARRVNKAENAKLQDFACPDCSAEFKQVTKGVYGAHRRVCKNWPETKMWEFATMHAEGVLTFAEMAEKLGVSPQTLFKWSKRMGLPGRQRG
jgi:group I intron endonuclease